MLKLCENRARRADLRPHYQSKIHLSNAERAEKEASKHLSKVAEIEKMLGQAEQYRNHAQGNLDRARVQEEKRRTHEAQRAARARDVQMRSIAGQLTAHEQMHRVTASAIEKLQQLPEVITVLFLAADPRDTEYRLQLDEEARSITEQIHKSKYREALKLESRWAVRTGDLFYAINDTRPRIVHFSGHGSDQDEIVFLDNDGNSKLVSQEAIAAMMAATSGDIQLVFFNTCYSHGQAQAVVEHVPAAIGMTNSIRDDAARVFASQFYSAIGFGLSVGVAFAQARATLMLESIPEEDVPELFLSPGLDAYELVLVKPPALASSSAQHTGG